MIDSILNFIDFLLSFTFIQDKLYPFFIDIGKYFLISWAIFLIACLIGYCLSKTKLKTVESFITVVMVAFFVISVIFAMILAIIISVTIWIFATASIGYGFNLVFGLSMILSKIISAVICFLFLILILNGCRTNV